MSITHRNDMQRIDDDKTSKQTQIESFKLGLLTNILNPKATLFFLSLYAIIITDQTTIHIQALYGIWMAIITTLWFSFLSILLTNKNVLKKIHRISSKVQLVTGLFLIVFAIKLLFSNQ